jgi:uncharacterized membrane protein
VELHEWLLFFHVVGSVVWVGAVIFQNAVMVRASRSPDRTAALRLTGEMEWAGPWLIGPSSLVVIGLGIWLVLLEEWADFSQLWIWLTLVLVAVSTVQGIYSGPEGKRIQRLADQRGTEDPEVGRRMSRMLWLARLDMAILLAVVWLMVFKPGA